MNIILESALLISGLYFLLILWLFFAWFKKRKNVLTSVQKPVFISVIVPFRNEEKNLTALLQCLKNQNYEKSLFEVIFIDDHSDDHSIKIIRDLFEDNYSIIRMSENEQGKKTALKNGISKVKGELIITIDADCTAGENWLNAIATCYLSEKPAMIAGPVDFHSSQNIFNKIQNLEFLSLIGTGASAINAQTPVFCNAANMAFEKKSFNEINDAFFEKHPSGDDVFLLHAFKKRKKKIVFLKNTESIVLTNPPSGLFSFVSQRKRWASKSRYYRNTLSIFMSVLVFLTSFFILISGFAALFFSQFLWPFIILIGSKTFIDLIFLIPVTGFFNKQYLLYLLIPMQPLYVVYVSFIGIFGNVGKINWKGRNI